VLAGTGPNGNNLVASGTLTVGAGMTVHGAGHINGDCANPLVNQGTISADTSNQPLYVSCFVNQGQLLATNGGILALANTFTTAALGTFRSVAGHDLGGRTLVNTNSTLALSASTGSLFLNGGTIQGGTVSASGGAQLLAPYNSFVGHWIE